MHWTKSLAIMTFALALSSLPTFAAEPDIETPKYKVIASHDEFEVRRYEPMLVAEVDASGNFTQATNRAFRPLADFIFGNNTSQIAEGESKPEEISMTAPVLAEKFVENLDSDVQQEKHVVSFVLPRAYNKDTIPLPNNKAVRIKEIPPKTYAVLTFSGRMSTDDAEEKKVTLLSLLAKEGYTPLHTPIVAVYDPPQTPAAQRKNEILVEIEYKKE